MSHATAAADCLVTDLNIKISGLGATRKYTVDLDRKDLSAQVVYVVPLAERDGSVSRYSNEREFDLQIVVIRPIDLAINFGDDDLDTAMDAVDEIKDLFGQDGALRDEPQAGSTWVGMRHEPLWDQERLKASRFVTSLTLTYAEDL